MKWTTAQETAIASKGRTLLVSAAAGSGKTAVLTARIIRQVTDPQNPADLARMLVVTYTKAAAAELRNRIQKALSEAMKADPSDRALMRQSVKLGHAKICTIHSFCYDMVRSNFEQLGIGANIRVADETEMKIIYGDVMDRVINELYDAQPDSCIIKDFAAFADNFVSDRDERLNDIMAAIYNKIRSYPDGVEFIDKSAQYMFSAASAEFMSSRFGGIIRAEIKKSFSYFISVYRDAVIYLSGEDAYLKNYLPAFVFDLEFMNRLLDISRQGTYAEIQSCLHAYSRPALGSGVKKNMQNDKTDFFRKIRDSFNNYRKNIAEKFFSSDELQTKDSMLKTACLCRDTYGLLRLFDEKLNSEKKSRGIVDFGDLEHMTYRLFYDGGNKTPFAQEQSLRYDEIYIDEYQDVNELQDRIFSAVSKKTNRFMVGDIKQSIYGFRGASPEIFSGYRDRFPKYDQKAAEASTLFLSDNFRSDRNIIDFNNILFRRLFSNNSGYVPYYDEDQLNYAKNDDGRPAAKVEIAVCKTNTEAENDDDEEDTGTNEAVYVVSRIRSLIKEGYRPKDITILLRSARNNAKSFEKELSKLNLPFYNGVTRDFFENAEVLLMLCLLNCIDNPARDIYLAGALRSQLFGITINDLVLIRKHGGSSTLYDALKKYTDDFKFEKGRFFLDKLKTYRKYAEGQPVDRLIWFIYRDTSIMSFTYEKEKTGRNIRHTNLLLLYEYARRFEAGSFRGLYNFIRYLNDIISERETLETAKISAESDDTVKIMTIHQSKGLEFPVCFLCGAEKKFNKNDLLPNILISRNSGIASKLRDSTGFARYDTPMRRALALKINENNMDEEMRVLYVALTRARERLIITASCSDPEKLARECSLASPYISSFSLSESPSYIKWILTALMSESYGECCSLRISDETCYAADIAEQNKTEPQKTVKSGRTAEEITVLLRERFEFSYPYLYMSKIPAKISVSKLYPSVLDEEAGTTGSYPVVRKTAFRKCPDFMELKTAEANAAERGTATHVFMQFCDFLKTEQFGIKHELERLVSDGFMPKYSADLVNIRQIEKFFAGRLYADMKNSLRLWRETRFQIHLPAAEFTEEDDLRQKLAGEHLLVQGVIDCFFYDAFDRLILVDYKTDSIPASLQNAPEEAEKMLSERHRRQISYYKTACEHLTGKTVDSAYIYSFGMGKEIAI